MYVRVLAGAFIIEGNCFLMMKRADTKKIAPGMWGGVGGHAEPDEINNPRTTCVREIYEETGIEENHIKELHLKYIMLRKDKAEISLIYYYIGTVGTRYYEDKTQEGKLYWINESQLFDRPMSFEVRSMLEHYRKIGHTSNDIYVGTISAVENKPFINWNILDAWEGIVGA